MWMAVVQCEAEITIPSASVLSLESKVPLPPPARLEWQCTPGTFCHASASAFAFGLNARLPTKAEVVAHLAERGNRPLFAQDVWTPTSDHGNAWVSVGNYDPGNRLGRLHEESCGGPPEWGGDSSSAQAFRSLMAIVKLKY